MAPSQVIELRSAREISGENICSIRALKLYASAIRTLVTDPTVRERMGKCARKSVIDRSWPGAFRKFWATTDV